MNQQNFETFNHLESLCSFILLMLSQEEEQMKNLQLGHTRFSSFQQVSHQVLAKARFPYRNLQHMQNRYLHCSSVNQCSSILHPWRPDLLLDLELLEILRKQMEKHIVDCCSLGARLKYYRYLQPAKLDGSKCNRECKHKNLNQQMWKR